jgi:predicted phosphodiesterase
MKLAILSDIHANLEALRATLDDAAARGADRIVCLGDIVGYNTDPDACVALLRTRDPLCVAGNHDRAVAGQITTERFSRLAVKAVVWTQAHIGAQTRGWLARLPLKAVFEDKLVIVHGALHAETDCDLVSLDTDARRAESFAALMAHPSGARVCAFGHTHRAGIFEWRDGVAREIQADATRLREDAFYLVNPGTVGQPRAADRDARYVVYDTMRQEIALHRVAYDLAAALAKTRGAGLAPPLAFLPRPLRAMLIAGLRAAGLERVARRIAG